jgi:heme/copper-type cytochrome/quinol oxidase subunit 4
MATISSREETKEGAQTGLILFIVFIVVITIIGLSYINSKKFKWIRERKE